MSDSAEKDTAMTKRPDESQTEFTVRCIQAEAWEMGYRSGFSNAMRRMSDEPDAPSTPNPYRVTPPEVKVGYHPCVGCGNLVPPDVEWCGGCPIPPALPLHRTEAGYPRCSTCDGGGCLDCTDPA